MENKIAAANKVHVVKEKVACGYIEASFVSTKDQCADSLTKYLRGGENQQRANAHLSVVKLEDWLPRRGHVTRAQKGAFSDKLEFFEPGVKRVFLSGPDFSKAVGHTPSLKTKIMFILIKKRLNISSLKLLRLKERSALVVKFILICFLVCAPE